MPSAPPLVRLFDDSHCLELLLGVGGVHFTRPVLAKLRAGCGNKRTSFPLRFAISYSGERKEKIGMVCEIARTPDRPRDGYTVSARWFRTNDDPPEHLGRFENCASELSAAIIDREAFVTAVFAYDRGKVTSIFGETIPVGPAGIFDDIVGITGVKRSPDGKLIYRLEITLADKKIEHRVAFYQPIRFTEELPVSLLSIASRISQLGLKTK